MLKIGTQIVDITPPIGPPTALAGFGGKTEFASGLMMPLLASCIVVDNSIEKIAFVSCDLLCLLPETIVKIKELAYKGTDGGIKMENMWIGCTHTHQGPDTIGIFYPGEQFVNKPDTEYLAILIRYIAGAIIGAYKNMHEGCSYGIGVDVEWRFSHNRRIDAPQVPGIERSIDPHVGTIAFKNARGEIIGVMVNYAAHATVLESTNYLLSPDYIGFLRKSIANELGTEPTVLFFNGPCGDINPAYPNLIDLPEEVIGGLNQQKQRYEISLGNYIEARMITDSAIEMKIREYLQMPVIKADYPNLINDLNFDFKSRILSISTRVERTEAEKLASELIRFILSKPMESVELAALIGKELAKKVVSSIKTMEFSESVEIRCISTAMVAESEDGDQMEEFPFFRNSKSFISAEKNNGKPGIEVEVNCMKFGSVLLFGFPGEVTNEISMRMKSIILSSKTLPYVFCFELLNGEIGYILSPEDFNVGGYETLISIGPNNGFRMEQILIDSASKLLGVSIPWKHELKIEKRQIARVKNLSVKF
jgi:hypothetical protein